MAKSLYDYYDEELSSLRDEADVFSRAHGRAAAALSFSRDVSADPETERLLQGTAFLTARIRRNIEDQFADFVSTLTDAVNPALNAQLPARAIVLCSPPQDKPQTRLPRGTTLDAVRHAKEGVKYSTLYQTDLIPFRTKHAAVVSLSELPPDAARLCGKETRHALTLTLETIGTEERPVPECARFFIDQELSDACCLYEWVSEAGAPLAGTAGGGWIRLSAPVSSPAFGENSSLFPDETVTRCGADPLHEYLCFPERFLFFDVCFTPGERTAMHGRPPVLIFPLRASLPEGVTERLEKRTDARCFLTNAVPAANLFLRRTEPVRLTHTRPDYPVTADYRTDRRGQEVFRITRVTLTREGGGGRETLPVRPLHAFPFDAADGPYWTARRAEHDGVPEWRIAASLPGLSLSSSVSDVLSIEALCTNGAAADRLSSDPDGRCFSSESVPGLSASLVRAPLPAVRRRPDSERLWKLTAHHALSRVGFSEGLEPLKTALRILTPHAPNDQNPKEYERSRRLASGVVSLSVAHEMRRFSSLNGSASGFGSACKVVLDEEIFRTAGGGVYLFSQLLEAFLSGYCALNSFLRLEAYSTQRDSSVPVKSWPPRAGKKPLL